MRFIVIQPTFSKQKRRIKFVRCPFSLYHPPKICYIFFQLRVKGKSLQFHKKIYKAPPIFHFRMTVTLNGKQLEEILEKDKDSVVLRTGEVIDVQPDSISERGNPLVRVYGKNKEYCLVEIVRSSNKKFGEESNEARQQLLRVLEEKRKSGYGTVRVKVIGTPEYHGDQYRAVCFTSESSMDSKNKKNLTPFDAHSVIVSDRVFYALCTQRRTEKRKYSSPFMSDFDFSYDEESYRVECYNKSSDMLKGFLKNINDRDRPFWEYLDASDDLIHAESRISNDILKGSREYGFPGINEGDNLLVRVVGDNKRMGKPTVTYFFEPVITIREVDEAIEMYEQRDIITTVTDSRGQRKTKDYRSRYIVRDLPILATFETEKFGKVGVGYVQRPEEEFEGLKWDDKRPFYLKKVWVKGGADYVGSLVKESEIIFNKGIILANFG